MRRQFFWHRFFSHQPDLNFENPAVQEAMFDVVRFWMDMGIDGFRLDAVPYLFEEEGPNCENHPKTHEFLAKLREMVDAEYPGRILLAEANQPPADVVDYFGTEEEPECQMCFHFPVMPRLYYSLREEKAAPIIDVLADTPAIPAGAQWGTFLRNHDELTLEMVTPEQRAAMYGWYAPDPRMRANVGIRRRLAPLLDNSRRRDRADPRPAAVAAGLAVPLLRRRDRHGRQHLAQRPRRRPHADAVDARPQRRLLRRRPGQALPAGRLLARLPLQQRQRRGPDGAQLVAAALGAGDARDPQAPPRLRPRRLRGLPVRQRRGPVVPAGRVGPRGRRRPPRRCSASTTSSRRPQAATIRVPEEFQGAQLEDLFGGQGFPKISDDGTITLTLGSRDFFWLRLVPGAAHG